MKILYEDKEVLAVEKPAGMLSEPDGRHPDILTALKEQKGTDCLLVHRLDRETGGVMLLAKNSRSAAALSEQIREGGLVKQYLAVVTGCPEPAEGRMTDLLFRDTARNKTFVVRRKRNGVREAVLDYRVLGSSSPADGTACSLVLVRLHTGRTHQIRVQFASRRYPLLGDQKYGGGRSCPLALWSTALSWKNLSTGELRTVRSFPAEDTPWNLFPDAESRELLP